MSVIGSLPWKRFAGFGALPLLSVISPVLLIPILSHNFGPHAWLAFTLGQSVGLVAAIAVGFGWTVMGPAAVARLEPADANDVLESSTRSRLQVFVVAACVAAIVAAFVGPDEWAVLSALTAVAFASTGLSPGWFFVGTGEPLSVAKYESVPRLAATLLSVVALLATGWVYAAALLPLAATAWSLVFVGRQSRRIRRSPTQRSNEARMRQTAGDLRGNLAVKRRLFITFSSLLSSGYTTASIPIFTLAVGTSGTDAVAFAAAMRLVGIFRIGVSTLINALQGWVAEDPDLADFRRARLSLAFMTCVGAGGGLTLGLALPLSDTLLFGPSVRLDYLQSSLAGLLFFCVSISACLSFHCLIIAERTAVISWATSSASIVGVPVIWIAGSALGATGGLVAVAAVEAIVTIWEMAVFVCTLKAARTR